MKTVRVKILFMIFVFSAVVPSVAQAMEVGDYNVLKKTLVVGISYLSYRAYLAVSDARQDARDFAKKERQAVYSAKKEFLAKVDKQELFEDSSGEKYYITSLKSELVQQVRNALKVLDIPDSLVEKILILGKEYKHHKKYSAAETCTRGCVTYAILFDNEFLATRSPFEKQFVFLHEGGHVRAAAFLDEFEFLNSSKLNVVLANVYGVVYGVVAFIRLILDESRFDNDPELNEVLAEDSELNEVLAEVYALAALIRLTKKDDFKNLIENLYMLGSPRPYFSPQEFVYYGAQFFGAQQRGKKLDVRTYARKIIADRKNDGYERKILLGAKRLLGSTQEKLLVKKRNAYNQKIEQGEKNLLKESIKK